MAKKLGKILLGLTAVGAASAGVYYWFKNKKETDFEDEFDEEFDGSFEDDNFELDDDLGEVSERGYVSLTPSAKEEEASAEEEAVSSEEETPVE